MSSPTSIPSGWIDGKPHHSTGADHIVINPATDEPVATGKLAGRGDVDAAVASARAAQPAWGRATPAERAGVLLALARALAAESDLLITEEVAHTGKPVRLATDFDIPGSIDNIDFFAGVARNLEGKASGEYSGDHTSSIRREPVGIVGTITPWNYPLQMAVWKVIPALAAGCAVVLKPAEITPLTTLTMARIATEAGLPDGVLNIVVGTGPEAGAHLAGHPGVDMVTFTGSTTVGRQVMAQAATTGARTQLISRSHRDKVSGMVDRARAAGARVVTGGTVPDGPGAFYPPTLVADVAEDSEIYRDEVFGPVLTVSRFTDDDDAIRRANDTPYGLAASAWTRDVYRAQRASREIHAGCVWINDHIPIISEMPHGGYGASGFGKDMSTYSLDEYLLIKHVMSDIHGIAEKEWHRTIFTLGGPTA